MDDAEVFFIGRYDQLKATLDDFIRAALAHAEQWECHTEIDRVAALVVTLKMMFPPGDHLGMLAIAINYLGAAKIAESQWHSE